MNLTAELEETLKAVGAKLWEKAGKRRWYFNEEALAELDVLSVGRYNSGWISAARTPDGFIPNSQAQNILNGKTWIDATGLHDTGETRSTYEWDLLFNLTRALERRLTKAEATP